MRSNLFFAVIAVCLPALGAAQNFTPLNVKQGLWEVTVTHSMSGMPAAPNIPPDVLAKMPPDQRARIEAMMTGKPTTDVSKQCITREKLEKHTAFSKDRGTCTRTVVNSTGSKLELKLHCEDKDWSSDGTFVLEVLSSDSTKGTMHMAANTQHGNMNMDFTMTSKYLGPDCGDVK